MPLCGTSRHQRCLQSMIYLESLSLRVFVANR